MRAVPCRSIRQRLGMACAMPSLLVLALGSPGYAQEVVVPAEKTCVDTFGNDVSGNVLVKIRGKVSAATDDGGLLISLAPGCAFPAPTSGDPNPPPEDVRKIVKEVLDKAREAGASPAAVEKAATDLEDDIKTSEEHDLDPGNQIQGGNDERIKQSQEDPGDGDVATAAAITAVAAACVAFSAGICTAALALLPSLLPAKISTEEIAGVASTINDLSQGRPVSAERLEQLVDVAERVAKVPNSDLEVWSDLTKVGRNYAATELGELANIDQQQAEAITNILNSMLTDEKISCNDLRGAAGLKEGDVVQVSTGLRNTLLDKLAITRLVPARLRDLRDCLGTVFVTADQ